MPGLVSHPLLAFLGLSCLAALYVAAMLWLDLRSFYSAITTAAGLVTQFFVLIVPCVACAYAQFLASRRSVGSRPRLWLQVAAAGFGAPLLGAALVLFVYLVVFNGSM